MIDKKQMLLEIRRAPIANRYNHLVSALEEVLKGDKNSETHKAATIIIRLHVKVNKESMMNTAKISYT